MLNEIKRERVGYSPADCGDQKRLSALEMLVAELLTGQSQLPDVLQTVGRRLLDVLVLGADQSEQMCDDT